MRRTENGERKTEEGIQSLESQTACLLIDSSLQVAKDLRAARFSSVLRSPFSVSDSATLRETLFRK